MNTFLHGVVRAAVETWDLPGPVLEIGSGHVEGQEELNDLRGFFPGRRFVGVDLRAGPGIDVRASVEALPLASGSAGVVLAMNVLEHVRHFWRGADEIRRVLRTDGVLLFSSPFYFHIHNHPADYWRFTPSAVEVLFEEYPARIIGRQGPRKRPLHVFGVAFREQHGPITPERFMKFQALLREYGRQPVSWWKALRHRLGRLICGPRPFAPYLEQGSWEVECQNPRLPGRTPRPLTCGLLPTKG